MRKTVLALALLVVFCATATGCVLLLDHTMTPLTEAKTKTSSSNERKEVTLSVVGSGKTKEEATRNALRSALEQTYGTFVSANTTIINDELVKEEISTITNNCVKSYKELSSQLLPNGQYVVTLQAEVSISGLVKYAKSKGNSVELSGATFGMNMKLKELNKQNEKKAISNLLIQLMSLENLFDYELKVSEPRLSTRLNCYVCSAEIHYLFNDNTRIFNELAFQVLSDLSLSAKEIGEYEKMGLPYYQGAFPVAEGNPIRFTFRNDYRFLVDDIVDAIGPDDYREINKHLNLDYYMYKYNYGLSNLLEYLMYRNYYCCKIVDNLHDPSELEIIELGSDNDCWNTRPWIYWLDEQPNKDDLIANLLHPTKIKKKKRKNGKKMSKYVKFDICIPKEDISKYSNFRVEPVPDEELRNLIPEIKNRLTKYVSGI